MKLWNRAGIVALPLAVVLSLVRSSSAISLITSEAVFNAAAPGLPVVQFEGIAPSGGFANGVSGNLVPGVTFAASNLDIVSASFSNFNYPGSPSDYLLVDHTAEDLGISFDMPVEAVGLRIALSAIGPSDPGGPSMLEVFDGPTLLASYPIQASGVGPFSTFFGLVNLDHATALRISNSSQQHTVAIDDLRFAAVPEASLSEMIGALLMAAACLYRRRRCVH